MNLMPNADRAALVDVVASLPPQQLVRAANIPTHDVGPGVTCLVCNASLAGKRSDERCDECGAAIGRTLQGNFLKFAHPAYIRQMVRGITFLLWGAAAVIVVATLSGVLAFNYPVQLQLIALGGGLTALLGMWLVTASEPNRLDGAWESAARKRIRLTLIVAAAGPLVNVLAHIAGDSSGMRIAFGALGLIFGAAAIVCVRESLLHLRKLALRIPNLTVAKCTLFATWGLSITLGITVALGLVAALLGPNEQTGEPSVGGVTCAGWLAVVGFGVMTIILLLQYRSLVTDQATFAEHTWAHPGKAATEDDTTNSDATG